MFKLMLAVAALFVFPSTSLSQSLQCASIFTRSSSLTVESGPVFERKTDDVFLVAVIERGYEFEATINAQGRVTIAAFLAFPEFGVRSHLRGNELFANMVLHFGAHRIKTISGRWIDGTNYDHFMKSIANGMSHTEAAATTWTGQQAALHGFSKVENVYMRTDKMTEMTTIYADFVRP